MQKTRVQFLGWEDPPGERNGNELQYSLPGELMGRASWWAAAHGVSQELGTAE